jgi:Zn finger protein HypA/HybF involved in hydrogenase expression
MIYRRPFQILNQKFTVCKNCKSKASQKLAFINARDTYEKYILRWKDGQESGMKGKTSISSHIRKYLFEKFNFACAKCSWSEVNKITGKIPLEVNHIDGNYKNNRESNLELICPNCHSLTFNYKSLNNGNGRPRIQ